MPRILPRLRENILQQGIRGKETLEPYVRPKRRTSLYRLVPPRPSFNPADYQRSILLSPLNPITNSLSYVQHKTLPPCPRLRKHMRSRRDTFASQGFDQPRKMTKEELQFWADPYLRMLTSPIRKCIFTSRYLPSDFLIRLVPARIPESQLFENPLLAQFERSIIPDGLEHSKFKIRQSGRGAYTLCRRDVIQEMVERETYRRILPNISVHSLLSDQVSHVLRVRILQEFELLVESLTRRPASSDDAPVVRRLTRGEWASIKSTGLIPHKNAVAVIVVPPLNHDPVTKQRTEPSMNSVSLPSKSPDPSYADPATHFPISTLHYSLTTKLNQDFLHLLPQRRTPLYNGIALFPHRPQRAAFLNYLTKLLSLERRSCIPIKIPSAASCQTGVESDDYQSYRKASHAFILYSHAGTAKRGDVAAVAIALWRLRMFEGGGWENENLFNWISPVSRKRPSE